MAHPVWEFPDFIRETTQTGCNPDLLCCTILPLFQRLPSFFHPIG